MPNIFNIFYSSTPKYWVFVCFEQYLSFSLLFALTEMLFYHACELAKYLYFHLFWSLISISQTLSHFSNIVHMIQFCCLNRNLVRTTNQDSTKTVLLWLLNFFLSVPTFTDGWGQIWRVGELPGYNRKCWRRIAENTCFVHAEMLLRDRYRNIPVSGM